MSKIIPLNSDNHRPRRQSVSGDKSKTGFIRDFIRLLKEAIALSLEESDECDDLYDE